MYPDTDDFYVQNNGFLYYPSGPIQMLPLDMYCVDNFVSEAGQELSAIVCIDLEEIEEDVKDAYVYGESLFYLFGVLK